MRVTEHFGNIKVLHSILVHVETYEANAEQCSGTDLRTEASGQT